MHDTNTSRQDEPRRGALAFAAAALAGAALMLAACGGGGGGGGSPTPAAPNPQPQPAAEEPDPEPDPEPAAKADPAPVGPPCPRRIGSIGGRVEDGGEVMGGGCQDPDPPADPELPFTLANRVTAATTRTESSSGAVLYRNDVRAAAHSISAAAFASAAKAAKRAPVFADIGAGAQSGRVTGVTQATGGNSVSASFSGKRQERHPEIAMTARDSHGVLRVATPDGFQVLSFDTAQQDDRQGGHAIPGRPPLTAVVGGTLGYGLRRVLAENAEDAENHDFGGVEPRSGAGRDTRHWRVLDVAADNATTGRVVIDTDAETADDWLSFGYWLALRGRDFIASAPRLPTVEAVEFGAFATGPEFANSPASLPDRGTATYNGQTVGAWMARFGPSASCCDENGNPSVHRPNALDGTQFGNNDVGSRGFVGMNAGPSTFTAEFEADMSLRMDFATGKITGTASNLSVPQGVFTEGWYIGVPYSQGGDGRVEPGRTFEVAHRTTGWEFGFSGSINRETGRFRGTGVSITDKTAASKAYRRIVESQGAWGGQLSSELNSTDEPRSIVGTFGIEAKTANEDRHVFIGAFGAHHENYIHKRQ